MITREDKGKVVVLWEVAARPKASNRFLSKRTPPLCHLDRSAPGFPASLPWTRPRVRLSLRKGAYCSPAQPTSTGNPGERSGEISVWMPFLGNVFRRSEGRDLQFPSPQSPRLRRRTADPSLRSG